MNKLIERSELRDIWEKVDAGQRITEDDCARLYRSQDLAAIGAMANTVRERKNSNVAYYVLNRHINYSNLCILDCDFCAFYRRRRDAGAYEYNLPQMIEKAQEALQQGITEIHIVGGLHPSFKWDYYVEMLRSLKALDPKLHLKAFTAIEILHLSWVGKRSVLETLAALREAGLGSLTGGGAEIFDPEVRSVICHAKESAEEWADVHRTWHKMGGALDLHDADRSRGEKPSSRGPFAAVARTAGRDQRIYGVRDTGLSSREHEITAPARAKRLRHAQDTRDRPHLPRQYRPHQGVLDSHGHETGPSVIELRC